MIYLIGGTPRVGKSKLAEMITKRKGISSICTDDLTHALDGAYPELGVRRDGWETIPDKFFEFLRRLLGMLEYGEKDFVVEGDAFFPVHADRFRKEFKVKSVFLGTKGATIEQIKQHGALDDWVSSMSSERQDAFPARMVEMSEMFEAEAKKYSIPYFDLSGDGEERFKAAYDYLMTP